MSSTTSTPGSAAKPLRFNGYLQRQVPSPDPELTSTDPDTPMGEYMRSFWQPVCLSEEVRDVPKAIRILGENLVAFRDRSGNVGVMHRHCAHRGASLEFGVIAEHGIRCCYHGWHYDIDGTLLDAPCEPTDTRLKQTVCQGAYPAFERDGLVFAYMGPPDRKPPFPEVDTYTLPTGTKLVPFSNIYPCNWLQVHENIMDHMHTAVLHNKMIAEGVDQQTAEGVSLEGFGDMPVMQWEATRGGNGIVFVAGRRLPDDKVWVRITEMVFPNYLQIGSLVPFQPRGRPRRPGLRRRLRCRQNRLPGRPKRGSQLRGGAAGARRLGSAHEPAPHRSEEHTSELQSPKDLVCRLLLEKKKGMVTSREEEGERIWKFNVKK